MGVGPGRLTFAEFLAYEAAQEAKHELVDGIVVDFWGGGLRHAAIVSNLVAAIRPHLNAPRIVVGSDAIIPTLRGARHADIAVADLDEHHADALVRAPILLIEVLSDATAVLDLTEKVSEYGALPALCEMLLVDSRKRWVQVLRRRGFEFERSIAQIAGVVELRALDVLLPLEIIYASTGVAA